MERIAIIGSGGAGKSTLARKLGEILELPVIHLDVHHWRAGWREPTQDEWEKIHAELLSGRRWIIDGNYGRNMNQRLSAADTIIFLDLPRWLCMLRVLLRVIQFQAGRRPDMAAGCEEKVDLEFLKWIWNYPKRSRPGVLDRVRDCGGGKRVVILRSIREVEVFIDQARNHRAMVRQ